MFLSRYTDLFEAMIKWQLDEGRAEAALEYAERGRARVLLDQLAAGKVDLRQSIPTDLRTPLEERDTRARARIAEYQARINGLATRRDLPDSVLNRLSAELSDSLRLADQAFRVVYEEIRNASPLWRDLITSGGRPVGLADIRRTLIPPRGLFALYQIGDERSFLFLASRVGPLVVVPLTIGPGNAAVLGVRAGPLHRVDPRSDPPARHHVCAAGPLLRIERVGPGPGGRRADSSGTAPCPLAGAGSDLGLDRLRGSDQVVLVPGRGLHTLPFEALVVTLGAGPASTRYWLDEGPAIRYAASATTLYNLERRASVRLVPAGSDAAVLSLSNPLFDAAAIGQRSGDRTPLPGREQSDRPSCPEISSR